MLVARATVVNIVYGRSTAIHVQSIAAVRIVITTGTAYQLIRAIIGLVAAPHNTFITAHGVNAGRATRSAIAASFIASSIGD
jgi:hypothetical protein